MAGFQLSINGRFWVSTEESDAVRVAIFAGDFGRFRFTPLSEKVIIFPYEVFDGSSELMAESRLKRDFPVNRTGFIGGLFLREDGAHVSSQQVLPGTA
jgi:hypothetical protein